MQVPNMRTKTYQKKIEQLSANDYSIAKDVFNKGKHPGFIGKGMHETASRNGGAFAVVIDKKIAAVALVNMRKNILTAINVLPEYRKSGIGQMLMNYISPNFCRVIEPVIPWFEKMGYVVSSDFVEGNKYRVVIMSMKNLVNLSRKHKITWEGGTKIEDHQH